jgi:probable biosynthetic protein (TIGR04099 family)
MAEMGYRGLSEQWLKRRAGDLHWRLIARAMGQSEALFTCSEGEPLYAAFCATSLQLSQPERPRLGGHLTLSAHLYRVGHGRLASLLRIDADGHDVGRMILVSTFVGRSEPENNRTIVRRSPRALAMPPDAPALVRRTAEQAALVARDAQRHKLDLGKFAREQHVLPCPATDFNAVGLLYFPSYSALADRALFQAGEIHPRMVAARHVVYLGNVEPGEWVDVSFRQNNHGYDLILRGAEDRLLAMMRVRSR